MLLDELADVRAGDKGETLMLSVFPRGTDAFELLERKLTDSAVAAHFRCAHPVTRIALPHLPALVFRLPGVLSGGVTGAAGLDGHGKTLSYHLLMLALKT